MSLKGFHVFFIVVCMVFLAGMGVWGIRDYQGSGQKMSMYLGLGAWVGLVILGGYGVWFLRKLRHLSFV